MSIQCPWLPESHITHGTGMRALSSVRQKMSLYVLGVADASRTLWACPGALWFFLYFSQILQKPERAREKRLTE